MTISILKYDIALSSVLGSNTVSLTTMKAYPLTEPYAAGFEAIQPKLFAVMTQETLLEVEVYKASARVRVASDAMSDLVDILCRTILNGTKGNRQSQLYALYFGNKRPSDIKNVVLGSKLTRLRDWISLLQVSTVPALASLHGDVEAAVNAADEASTALNDAKLKSKAFRTVGARKAIIDEFNALRKLTYGLISELPHKHPEKNLPGNFAYRFFRHEAAKKGDGQKSLTSEELAILIEGEEAKLAALKQRFDDTLAGEVEAEKESAQAEEAKAAIAIAEKVAEEALAKVAALKAKRATT